MPPSVTPATPPSAPPPFWSGGPPADPPDDLAVGGAEPADSAAGELLAAPLVAELAGGSEAGGWVGVSVAEAVRRVLRVGAAVGFVLGVVLVLGVGLGFVLRGLVGFGSVGFGVEDGVAASCGQMASARVLGGGVFPPSCHTQPSVDPGFGSWVPAPSLA